MIVAQQTCAIRRVRIVKKVCIVENTCASEGSCGSQRCHEDQRSGRITSSHDESNNGEQVQNTRWVVSSSRGIRGLQRGGCEALYLYHLNCPMSTYKPEAAPARKGLMPRKKKAILFAPDEATPRGCQSWSRFSHCSKLTQAVPGLPNSFFFPRTTRDVAMIF